MARGRGGSATAEWREPTSSDRLPIHRSESPTGYSSAGCSPAEPASASRDLGTGRTQNRTDLARVEVERDLWREDDFNAGHA
jgi:hypothetical protein